MKFSSKICVPLKPNSMQSCSELVKKAEQEADIIEIWLDEIADLDLEELMKLQKKPFLIVQKSGPNKTSRTLQAAQAGAKYIDLDLNDLPAALPQIPAETKLIISYHNFERTPSNEELANIIDRAKSHNPHIIKIATHLNSHSDSFRLLQLLEELTKSGQDAIILGMGPLGPLNRIYGCYLGNYLTFAPLDQESASAPGQLTLLDLQKIKNII